MQKPIWLFGGIAGLLCALTEFWFYSAEPLSHELSQNRALVMMLGKLSILLICIIFGLILLRKIRGGTISIARTIFSGILIAVVRGVIMILAFLVLYAPDGSFYSKHREQTISIAQEKILADEEIEEAGKALKISEAEKTINKQFSPLGYATFALFGSMMTGLVVSILVAVFIAKNMMLRE